jgi:hypothetical protein
MSAANQLASFVFLSGKREGKPVWVLMEPF